MTTAQETLEAPIEKVISFSGEKQETTAVYPGFFRSGVADTLLAKVDEERFGRLDVSPYDCIYVIGQEDGYPTISVYFEPYGPDGRLLEPRNETYRAIGDKRDFSESEYPSVLFSLRQIGALEQIPDGTIIVGSDYFDSELSRRRVAHLAASLS